MNFDKCRFWFKHLLNKHFALISIGQILMMSIVVYALVVLAAQYRFGSVAAGRAYFTGTRLFAEPFEIEGYYNRDQKELNLIYHIRNLDSFEVPIVGASASCTCTVTENLPDSILAGGISDIPAKIHIEESRKGDDIRGEIRVYTTHPKHPEILLSYRFKPMAGNSSK